MTKEIKSHYTNEEIISINMKSEVNMFKEHLYFVFTEIKFFKNLLSARGFLDESKNEEDVKFLFDMLDMFKETTEFHNQTVLEFRVKLGNIRECDDVQCEIHYIQEYELLKTAMQKHLLEFQKLKEVVHKFISKNLVF